MRAPAELALEVAEALDLLSLPAIRGIFRLRSMLLRADTPPPRWPRGLVAEMTAIGWGVLGERPGREIVLGTVTRPWEGNVRMTPIPPDRFAAFAEPDLVKIAWTLEVEPEGPDRSRLRTETRAAATDDGARRRFRRYWRRVVPGVVLFRWLALRGARREAERRHRPVAGPA